MIKLTKRSAAITVAWVQLVFWLMAQVAACFACLLTNWNGSRVVSIVVVVGVLAVIVWFQVIAVTGVIKKTPSFTKIWLVWAAIFLGILIAIIPLYAVYPKAFQSDLAFIHTLTSRPLVFFSLISIWICIHCIFSGAIAVYTHEMNMISLDGLDSQSVPAKFSFQRFAEGEYRY